MRYGRDKIEDDSALQPWKIQFCRLETNSAGYKIIFSMFLHMCNLNTFSLRLRSLFVESETLEFTINPAWHHTQKWNALRWREN